LNTYIDAKGNAVIVSSRQQGSPCMGPTLRNGHLRDNEVMRDMFPFGIPCQGWVADS
jgi:hypothetical protein